MNVSRRVLKVLATITATAENVRVKVKTHAEPKIKQLYFYRTRRFFIYFLGRMKIMFSITLNMRSFAGSQHLTCRLKSHSIKYCIINHLKLK